MSIKIDSATSFEDVGDAKALQMATKDNSSFIEGSVGADATDTPSVQFDTPYGWVIVLAVLIIDIHTWGMSAAYGVLLSYYTTNESFRATEPIEYAYLGGLSISCAFLISPRLL